MSGATNQPGRLGLRQRVTERFRSSSASKNRPNPQPSTQASSASNQRSGQSSIGSNSIVTTPTPSSQTPSLKILDNALSLLSDRDRATVRCHVLPNTSDIDLTLIQALAATKLKQQFYQEKRKFVFAGREIDVKKEADKVIYWLDRFKSVGDVAANANAVYAGLPWAGIRVLLEATVSDANQMTALLVGCGTALDMINRLKVYINFLDGLPPSLARTNFETALTKLYSIILRFLAQAIQIYETPTFKRSMQAFWKDGDVQNFEQECDKLGQKLEIEASNCDRTQDQDRFLQLKRDLQTALDELMKIQQVQESVNRIETRIILDKLPFAQRATFNSYGQDHTGCHPGTRTNVLRKAHDWAQQPGGESIFWVTGVAGIGKSTISWTFANWLTDQARHGTVSLGASFFFKRGEGDRGNASRFFSTIVRELILQVPGLDSLISQAINSNPTICDKGLAEQFDKLIFQPLQRLTPPPHFPILIMVVDALDECDRESDSRVLLALWSRLREISTVKLKLFLTSRPESPIRLGFKKMGADIHRDLILHDEAEVPRTVIQQDISTFLTAKLSEIREDYDGDPPLPLDWPGEKVLHRLVDKAVPLFIIATTIYRYVSDPNFDEAERLEELLQFQGLGHMSQIQQTYSPILINLAASLSEPNDKDKLYQEFRMIVGSIVVLAEPLSVNSLSSLLNVRGTRITSCLRPLYSVLIVPGDLDTPVQTLHLSFREFLVHDKLDDQKSGTYFVDGPATHLMLLSRCLDVLSGSLRENICDFSYEGQPRREVESTVINQKLPPALQYASQYWVYHVEHSHIPIKDDDRVHGFLKEHLLHWLEIMSLIGRLYEVMPHISMLQSLLSPSNATNLSLFLDDALRIARANRQIIDIAPLQVYSSAMIFAPEQSIVKKIYGKVPAWLKSYPAVPPTWNLEVQKLEGQNQGTTAVAFSPDGAVMASGGMNGTVTLWNSSLGQELQTFRGHTGWVSTVAFSHDGTLLASGSSDTTIKLWNPVTGQMLQTLRGHTESVKSIAFSPVNAALASGSNFSQTKEVDICRIILWDCMTGTQLQTFEGHRDNVLSVAFSPNGDILASASWDCTVRLWDVATGQELQILDQYPAKARMVAFPLSPKSTVLAMALSNGEGSEKFCGIRLWHLVTQQYLNIFKTEPDEMRVVAFSSNGDLLASAEWDTITLWDTATGQELQILQGHTSAISMLAFSPHGDVLASASDDRTIRLWNTTEAQELPKLELRTTIILGIALSPNSVLLTWGYETISLWNIQTGQELMPIEHSPRSRDPIFSPSGALLALISSDSVVRIFSSTTGEELHTLDTREELTISEHDREAFAFSNDSATLAVAFNLDTVKLWNFTTGEIQQMPYKSRKTIQRFVFSPDDSLLAVICWPCMVTIWDVATRQEVQMFENNADIFSDVKFSPSGTLLAIVPDDHPTRLWDPVSGEVLQKLGDYSDEMDGIAFSPDSTLLASFSPDDTIKLWSVVTGQELQTFKGYERITTMSFTTDNSILRTNVGAISLGNETCGRAAFDNSTDQTLVVKDGWIQRNGQNLLWLPHDYRKASIAFSGNEFAFGLNSGLLSFLRFNLD